MKETITLQLGEFSNYVGSHYWNYQLLACLQQSQSGEEGEEEGFEGLSEIASRLFREQVREGVFQPRVLISDLRLNVGRLIGDHDETGDDSGGGGGVDAVLEWGGSLSKMTRSDVPDRNPFQQFLQSCGVESYDGESVFMRRGGAGASGGRAIPSAAAAAASVARRPPESCIEYWTDFSSVCLDRDVNLCLMPRWTTRDNFDTFLSVHLPEVVPREYTENFMEKLRFLAEECDSLSTIQVFADIHNGFGALACRLAQEIREYYGRGVNLPVWAFAADDEGSEQGARAAARSDLGESLHRLSVPYVYSQLCEHASLVVPIAPAAARSQRGLPFLTLDRGSQYHSSAVVASAIEAATGFQNDLSASMSADEWFFRTTSSGRFPVCELETTLPFPLAPSDSLEDFARLFGPTGVSGEMLEKMSARDDRNREKGGGGGDVSKAPRSIALNPFLHSLSSTVEGPFAVSSAVADKKFAQSGGADPEHQYRREHQRPFTNMVSIRGPCPEKLPALLFSKCDSPSYLVTACIRQQSALAVPSTFPHFFRGVDWSGWAREKESAMGTYASLGTFSVAMQQQQLQQLSGLRGAPCSNITVLSAVGCDARVGVHLERTASAWARSVGHGRIRAQIEKVGGDKTELAEVGEKILVLSRAYDQNNEL